MRFAAVFVALVPALAAAAPAELLDRAQLAAALGKGSPCCVIDARPVAARMLKPLPDALVYRKGMKINPTAAVIVIADTDDNGLRAGDDLERVNKPPRLIVVKGGLRTWEAAKAPTQSAGGAVRTFVIPKNTCEQGEPLQTLRTAPAAKTK